MTEQTTDLVTRTTSLEATASDHEKRISDIETKGGSTSAPAASGFSDVEIEKIRFVMDKYFPLETPPVPVAS